jgi:hypothetical protein
VKTGQIFGSSGHEMNPRFKSLRIGLANPDLQICELGFVTTIQNESTFLRISYTIPASLIFVHFVVSKYFVHLFKPQKKTKNIPDLVSREISAKMFSLFIPSARHKREKDEQNRLVKKQTCKKTDL